MPAGLDISDAQAVGDAVLEGLKANGRPVYYEDTQYFHEIQRLKAQWEQTLRKHRKDI